MYLLLQNTPIDNSYLGATIDVLFFTVVAVAISTLGWYFFQKKDKEEIKTLKKSLDKVQPQHDVLQNQHEHLKSEHNKVKQALADLMDNYQELETKHADFLSKQSSTKNLYEQVDEERQSLLDSYESMESNYNALDLKYNDAVTTLDRLEEEIEILTDEKADLTEALSKLENSLAENGKTTQVDNNKNEEGDMDEDDEIEKLIGASQARKLANKAVPKVVDVQEVITIQKNHELQTTYEALKEDYNQLRNEHTHLNNQYYDLKEAFDLLKVSKEETSLEKETTSEETQEKLTLLQEKHNQLLADYSSMKEELEEKVLPKLRATQALLNQKEESHRQLVIKLEEQTAKIQSSSSQLKNFVDVKATSQALYISNKNLTEKNTDLEKQYEKLNTKHKDLMAQFQLLREQFTLAESKLETMEPPETSTAYEQLTKDYEVLKSAFDAQENTHANEKERLLELENLIKSINDSNSYGITYSPTSLDIIDGIPSKVSTLLHKFGIKNWSDLAVTEVDRLTAILKDAGKRYEIYNPTTWPQQAQLLAGGNWKAFKDLEAELISQRKRKENQIEFDDLKVIEGIGPKIEVLLNNANIYTWKKLSKTGIGELKRILKAGGSIYETHDPSTWPEQASLAVNWNWTELEALQAELKAGREQV